MHLFDITQQHREGFNLVLIGERVMFLRGVDPCRPRNTILVASLMNGAFYAFPSWEVRCFVGWCDPERLPFKMPQIPEDEEEAHLASNIHELVTTQPEATVVAEDQEDHEGKLVANAIATIDGETLHPGESLVTPAGEVATYLGYYQKAHSQPHLCQMLDGSLKRLSWVMLRKLDAVVA